MQTFMLLAAYQNSYSYMLVQISIWRVLGILCFLVKYAIPHFNSLDGIYKQIGLQQLDLGDLCLTQNKKVSCAQR